MLWSLLNLSVILHTEMGGGSIMDRIINEMVFKVNSIIFSWSLRKLAYFSIVRNKKITEKHLTEQ